MDDLLEHGPERPPRRSFVRPRWIDAACVLAVVAAVAGFAVGRQGPASTPTAVASPAPAGTWISPIVFRTGDQTVGILIDGVPSDRFGALDSHDDDAEAGPSSTVVRRHDGSLGRHGAVVTYPVPATATGTPVRVGTVDGRSSPGEVVWPVAGGYARVRSDLPSAEMLAIAAATTVRAGRPVVVPPHGFRVAASGTYRPAHVRQVRYGAEDIPGAEELGGLVFTAVASGGALEDRLYADRVYGTGSAETTTVLGRPAVVTSSFGGNAAIAWEPAPGVVAYVGYSGSTASDATVDILRDLVLHAHLLDERQWQDTSPTVVAQRNTL